MSYFKVKMHQIRPDFRCGFAPDHAGKLTAILHTS